ncbi:hypothetical protein BDQ94DRAFT_82291 [Aspergillus welwitschiae]|uniref:Uncharacterized protein n=1 Tax=Aspergillus welwitschiae TaxID=1341132 RepID=A0A3F3PS04_9EURO|nr:hypothetical protein BDQ94DRAFT_82291 [Aspergillus welwitschiae]RDH29643.1 hypothetical protein BDQ94DRAFT_82291 [Aspergillus welwitschiae]
MLQELLSSRSSHSTTSRASWRLLDTAGNTHCGCWSLNQPETSRSYRNIPRPRKKRKHMGTCRPWLILPAVVLQAPFFLRGCIKRYSGPVSVWRGSHHILRIRKDERKFEPSTVAA